MRYTTETPIWSKGQAFCPDKVSAALNIVGTSHEHPAWGFAYAWTLPINGNPQVRLEFFEKHRLFRLGIADPPGDYERHDYSVQEMGALIVPDVGRGLRVKAYRRDHFSVVTILTNGTIDEARMLSCKDAVAPDTERMLAPSFGSDGANLARMKNESFLTVGEAAKNLNVPPSTLRSHISAGNLPVLRLGRRHCIIAKSDLDRLISEGRLRAVKRTADGV
jgi:excisionase family DNA binding protein